jgi:hypothetical protein
MQRASNHSGSLAILLVALTLVAGCGEQHSRVQLDPTAPLASPAAPLRSLNYADPVALSFYSGAFDEISVEQAGPFSSSYEAAFSRCPDEPMLRPGSIGLYLTGKTLVLSAADPANPADGLTFFSIPFEMLAFAGYTTAGPTISKAN